LYTTLKLENLAAVVSLGEEWYGAIHYMIDAKSETKKKLNLTLSVFTPGKNFCMEKSDKKNSSYFIKEMNHSQIW
jgi:hypothetical protein